MLHFLPCFITTYCRRAVAGLHVHPRLTCPILSAAGSRQLPGRTTPAHRRRPPGPCWLRAAAAVTAITTSIPLLSSQGSAHAPILVATQIADAPILTSANPTRFLDHFLVRPSTLCSTIIVAESCPARACVVLLFLPLHYPGSSLRTSITTSASPWYTISPRPQPKAAQPGQAGTTTEPRRRVNILSLVTLPRLLQSTRCILFWFPCLLAFTPSIYSE
jgi:hypothetical protein